MSGEGRDQETLVFPQSAHCEHFQTTFELLGKRWTAAILRTLFAGCSRFTEIADTIPGLSNRLLAERLGELTAAGLVVSSGGTRPVYSLSDKGRDLKAALSEIEKWNRVWSEGGLDEDSRLAPKGKTTPSGQMRGNT